MCEPFDFECPVCKNWLESKYMKNHQFYIESDGSGYVEAECTHCGALLELPFMIIEKEISVIEGKEIEHE